MDICSTKSVCSDTGEEHVLFKRDLGQKKYPVSPMNLKSPFIQYKNNYLIWTRFGLIISANPHNGDFK